MVDLTACENEDRRASEKYRNTALT